VVGAVREPPLHAEGIRAGLFERSEFAARPQHTLASLNRNVVWRGITDLDAPAPDLLTSSRKTPMLGKRLAHYRTELHNPKQGNRIALSLFDKSWISGRPPRNQYHCTSSGEKASHAMLPGMRLPSKRSAWQAGSKARATDGQAGADLSGRLLKPHGHHGAFQARHLWRHPVRRSMQADMARIDDRHRAFQIRRTR